MVRLRPVRNPGYTLIELLAVVVVLGLAAGIGIPPLVRMAGGTPLDRACATLRGGDARARLLARETALDLTFDLEPTGLRCRTARHPLEVSLPEGAIVTWLAVDGRPLRSLAINPRGRSQDLIIQVTVARDARRFRLLGLSGEWNEGPASP